MGIVRNGLIVLIIGGVLLAAGLVIAGFSVVIVTREVLEGSTIIDPISIEPNLSYVTVLKDLPAGQLLVLSLSTNPSEVPLQAKMTEPDGTILAMFNVTSSPFTSTISTRTSGDHTVEIKNLGTSTVTISGGLLNSPLSQQGDGVAVQDNSSLQTLINYGIALLGGIALIISGIVLLIIGAIKYTRSGTKSQQPPTT